MTQQQGRVNGDTLQKIGSVGFIIGAILMMIGSFLLPRATNPSNLQEMLKPLGEQEFRTQVSALLMTAGIWALMIGAAGVTRSINTSGAAWARLGFYFIVVGTALWTVSLSGDVATASAVANWVAAPAAGKEAAFGVVAALSAFGRGVYPMSIVVFWLAIAFLGIGMVSSAVYPRWLGWVGLILGVAVIPVGITQTFAERSIPLTLVFMVFALLTALWSSVVGIWGARKAWHWFIMNK